jgi:hypothetical protein
MQYKSMKHSIKLENVQVEYREENLGSKNRWQVKKNLQKIALAGNRNRVSTCHQKMEELDDNHYTTGAMLL